MLDPIPIIFVLTALVGIVVLVSRHFPEWQAAQANPQPTWAKKVTIKSVTGSVSRHLLFLLRQLYRALLFAKSEFKNSKDLAKHLSESVRYRLERRKVEVVADRENQADEQRDRLSKAEKLLEKGDYLAAEESAIGILKEDSTFRPAYEFLGTVYLARKNWLEAVEIHRYLIKQSPSNDKYWRNLGHGLVGLEDYAEAKKAYHKSLEIYPNPEVSVALGLAYQALADYNSAVKAFESALDLEPENTQVLMLLAQCLLHRNEKEAAREVLEQILELEPNNHLARERLMQLKI